MKKLRTLFFLMMAVFITTFFFTGRITSKLSKYEEKKLERMELLSAENRLTNAWEWLPGWLSPGEQIMEDSWEIDKEANRYYNSAVKDGVILLLIIITFLVVINVVYKSPDLRSQAIGLSLVIASICFFYLGINEPFIEIEAFKDDVEVHGNLDVIDLEIGAGVEGRVYFFYHNKSVLKLIELLYKGGNFFVAIALFVFSIVFPIIKLTTSFVIFLGPEKGFSKNAVAVIDKIGKWSMADVFVAGAWLAYFSFANTEMAIETGSSTLIGLYFFTIFVVFSIISGIYLKRTVVRAHQNINGG
ncbi:MAG: paraquat-inducible protein A [Crocinitomicaceae bacterium]|nr:paraquat-inducible protein A [Crocinitomicaceae bacterium]